MTQDMLTMRVGLGYDVHELVTGRKLMLGGVDIPFEKGLMGHSDADVLVHAACDALLGAAGLGDLGMHFQDTASEYKDIYSIRLLEATHGMIRKKGFIVVNMDATVFAQAPKLRQYKTRMAHKMADAVDIEPGCVNIKATTTEGLGFAGRGEGIGAMCVVLLNAS